MTSIVDSSIGGKTGINFNNKVNLLGSFYHPNAIFVDMNFILSLPNRDFNAGLCESIKKGFIYNKDLFNFIDVNYIYDAYFLRDSLYVLTENGIFTNNLIDVKWVHELPIEYKTSFYDIVKGLHTGYYLKPFLKPLNTLSSFVLILLILTGILLFMKKIKR